MKLVRRLLFTVGLTMAVAPLIGVASEPIPTCWPCPDGVVQAP